MNRRLYLLFPALLSLLLCINLASRPPMAEGASPAWQAFSSRAGGFTINFPGAPTTQTKTMQTAVGPVSSTSVQLAREPIVYIVNYTDYPAAVVERGNIEKMLDGARDGAAKNTGGTVLKDTRISFHGYHAREVTIGAQGGALICRARLYVIGHRLYQVLAVGPKSQASSPNIDTFQRSFKLLGK